MCMLCVLEDFVKSAPPELQEGADIARLVIGLPTRAELDANPNIGPDPDTLRCMETMIRQDSVIRAVSKAMEWALNADHDVAGLTPAVFTALGIRIAQGYKFPAITPPAAKAPKAQDGMKIELTMENLGIGMGELLRRTAARIGEDREPVMADLLDTMQEIAQERETADVEPDEPAPEITGQHAEPTLPDFEVMDHDQEIKVPSGFTDFLNSLQRDPLQGE